MQMETRRNVFSFLVGLGVTVFLAIALRELLENTLSWPAILSFSVALGFFVRESIQKDIEIKKRALFSLAVGIGIYVIYVFLVA